MTPLPKQLLTQLPALYEKEGLGLAAQATIKFFLPGTGWTWYPTEFDGDDILFGLVIGHVAEFGYFRLSELEALRSPLGLRVERDLYFKPRSLGELRDHYEKEGWAL